MNRPRGVASILWGKYDPNPVPSDWRPRNHLRLVHSVPVERPDPMCDYIEEAEWWVARSDYSIRHIQRAFDNNEIACCLYERVGAMMDLGRYGRQYEIAIQLVTIGDDWDLDCSLSDAGIYLQELYKWKE